MDAPSFDLFRLTRLKARLLANWDERDDITKQLAANEWEAAEIERQLADLETVAEQRGQPVSA